MTRVEVHILLFAVVLLALNAPVAQAQVILQGDSAVIQSFDGRTMVGNVVRVAVPEVRPGPSRMISVAALRIPSEAESPGNPIVFLMGGPGIPGSVMTPIPPYFTLFDRLLSLGDVIIPDQRSLGMSVPSIDCPFADPLPTAFFASRTVMREAIMREVVSCRERLRAEGGDVSGYNTVDSAEDIEAIRVAIGAEQLDFVGFSYGSRLALMYAQKYGDKVGRLVLQGVNGPGLVLKRAIPVDRKLERVSGILRGDPEWSGPTNMLAEARSARERLMREPASLTITDQRSGEAITLRVGVDGLDAIVGLNLDHAFLPALLVSVAGGDHRILAHFVETAWNGLSGGSVSLMARAVNCAADRPLARWELVRDESAGAIFGMPIDNEFLTDDFCGALNDEPRRAEFAEPWGGPKPILMLTGGLDATNPIENAHDLARSFPGAVILEVENAAHEMLPLPQVQDVIVRFLGGEEVEGTHLEISPPRFPTVEDALASVPSGPG